MRHVVDYIKKHKVLLLVLIPAFIYHMLIIVPSGSEYCFHNNCGLYFWGAHAHDAVWHLALASTSFTSYPFISPIYAGGVLSGYNLFMDLVLYVLSLIGISPLFSFFKILPLVWFVFFTTGAILLARKLHDSPIFVSFFLLMVFFGGSFGYFFTLRNEGSIWNSSYALAMQAGHMLINQQFAYSLAVLWFMLILLKDKTVSVKNTLLMSLLMSLNIGLKFYGGVLSISLACLYLLELLFRTKSLGLVIKHAAIVFASALVSVLLFYNPLASTQTGAIFTFAPFAIAHSIIEERHLFYLKDTVNARYYLQQFGWGPRLLLIELQTVAIYVFFNLGIRFLGLFYFVYKIIVRKVTRFDVYVFLVMTLALVLSMTLIQKGEWWNTVQFFYYTIVLSNIFIAELLYRLVQRKHVVTYLLVGVLIILTMPVTADVLKDFVTTRPAYIPQQELKAFKFLKKQPPGVVFHSFNRDKSKTYPFLPYQDTSYIPAFTGKQSYLANFVQLRLTGIDYSERLSRVGKKDCTVFKEVEYIYFHTANSDEYVRACRTFISANFQEVYRNSMTRVYEKK